MKEWTRDERYRELTRDAEADLEQLHSEISRSRWRCDYHVQTVTGLMGDTNGFSWFNGRWHLFYQWFPYGPVHGLKHWYHVSGRDLIHWENEGVALIPQGYMENKGAFSGSGYAEGDTLYLPYTGNHRDEDWTRTPYQLLAKMDRDGHIVKQKEMLYGPVPGYTEHQRDPKLFKYNGMYYFLLGVQNEKKKGCFLLFTSEKIETGWKLLGELKVQGYEDFGFMCECPDLERVGDDWLLLFSPQGVAPKQEEFRNVYQNVYFIGKMDFENLTFIPNGPYKELDRGFDFYAAQCAGQTVYEDKAVMVAWFGVSDYAYPPTCEEGYSGLQTMARILSIENGELKQRPPLETEELIGETILDATEPCALDEMPAACIIDVDGNEPFAMRLFARSGEGGLLITWQDGRFTVERKDLDNQLNVDYGTDRFISMDCFAQARIFVDHSSVEIFINDGDYVLSARVFPVEEEKGFIYQGKGHAAVRKIIPSVKDDFVIFGK
ncbi:MAG: sucrose-6-phosphate hydrolase [Solobacterium sp.]|nr:sucrose-6-phosphate hydrolase [Solobacterium sp.]